MRVVHLSTFGGSRGAARAAYRLHRSLLNLGLDSTFFVRISAASSDPTVRLLHMPLHLRDRAFRFLRRKLIAAQFGQYHVVLRKDYDYFTDDRTDCGVELPSQMPDCDIINLHWVAGFVDYCRFFRTITKPMVWRLSDMNPFTGGCHFDRGCGRYSEHCGSCPQLRSKNENDLSRMIWNRKMAAFAAIPDNRLHIVAPSQWIAKEVTRSTLLKRFPVTVIPNGLNIEDFAPRDKLFARDVLRLPHDAKIVLFVADAINEPRKGMHLLAAAMKSIGEDVPSLLLVSLGSGCFDIGKTVDYQPLGRLDDDRFISLAYSAADVFVIPALQDNFPSTALESLACGTPVVGFSIGGIPDMVRSGVTGLVVPPGDMAGLRQAIVAVLKDDSMRGRMAVQCRQTALKEYTMDLQARRTVQLYASMTNEKKR